MKRQRVLDRSNRDGGALRRFSGRCSLPARMAFTVAALTLTACATAPEPRIITRTVEVPVSVPCAVNVTEPAYVDTDEAIAGAPNLYELAKLYAAGRLQRIGALGEYRAAVKGCR